MHRCDGVVCTIEEVLCKTLWMCCMHRYEGVCTVVVAFFAQLGGVL